MNWKSLDLPTRVGFVATVLAALSLLFPPIFLLCALVGLGFSGTAWRRARRSGETNQVAKICTLLCAGLLAFVIIGSTIYAVLN